MEAFHGEAEGICRGGGGVGLGASGKRAGGRAKEYLWAGAGRDGATHACGEERQAYLIGGYVTKDQTSRARSKTDRTDRSSTQSPHEEPS